MYGFKSAYHRVSFIVYTFAYRVMPIFAHFALDTLVLITHLLHTFSTFIYLLTATTSSTCHVTVIFVEM